MRSLRVVDASAQRGAGPTAVPAHRLVSGRRAMLAGVLLLGACESDPMGNHLWGFGDPVRGVALNAPRSFGNTARLEGQPARAAMAAAEIEFLAVEMRTNPRYSVAVSPSVLQQLDLGRDEMRGFLGIAPGASGLAVSNSLRRVAGQLRDGDSARAAVLLDQPAIFTAGPLVTLARLNAMPQLRQVGIAADQVANEINRLDNRRV